jgi:hypothetical protein
VLFTFNFCDRLCGGGSFNEEPHFEAFRGPVILGSTWRILMDGRRKIYEWEKHWNIWNWEVLVQDYS